MKRLTDSDINKDIANAIEKMCPDKSGRNLGAAGRAGIRN